MKYLPAFLVVVFACLFWSQGHATWKPEMADNPPGYMAWFKSAQLTKAAQERFPYKSCCEAADRVKTKFQTLNGHWAWLDGDTWREIPDDVVHDDYDNMPAQLRREGVMFIYGGRVTCFWPPETTG